MHTRRMVVMSTPALLAFLAGCKTPLTPSQDAQDISLISQALNNSLPAIATAGGMTPVFLAKLSKYVLDVEAAATAFAAADVQAAQQQLVLRIEADVSSVVNSLSVVGLPAAVAKTLQMIDVLLPIVEAAVGIVATGAHRMAAPLGTTPDEARSYLRTV